jgi:hypothetical protein
MTQIVLSIIVLPGVIFLIVCLMGFHRALVSETPIRPRVERLEANKSANGAPLLRTSSDDPRSDVAIQKWRVL